jgi:hypothetical protein
VDHEPIVPRREHACGAGVIEVDVREEEVPEVAELESMSRERGFERRHTGGRAAVDQCRLVAVQEVRRDDPGVPEEEEVEELGAAT